LEWPPDLWSSRAFHEGAESETATIWEIGDQMTTRSTYSSIIKKTGFVKKFRHQPVLTIWFKLTGTEIEMISDPHLCWFFHLNLLPTLPVHFSAFSRWRSLPSFTQFEGKYRKSWVLSSAEPLSFESYKEISKGSLPYNNRAVQGAWVPFLMIRSWLRLFPSFIIVFFHSLFLIPVFVTLYSYLTEGYPNLGSVE
jgi:hypothetical protein